jgi:HTH domain
VTYPMYGPETADKDLSDHAFRVYAFLHWLQDSVPGQPVPVSAQEIAWTLHRSTASVWRSLKELRAGGYVEVLRGRTVSNEGPGSSPNSYILLHPRTDDRMKLFPSPGSEF